MRVNTADNCDIIRLFLDDRCVQKRGLRLEWRRKREIADRGSLFSASSWASQIVSTAFPNRWPQEKLGTSDLLYFADVNE